MHLLLTKFKHQLFILVYFIDILYCPTAKLNINIIITGQNHYQKLDFREMTSFIVMRSVLYPRTTNCNVDPL